MPERFQRNVGVIGGGGRVGLPLALMFADGGLRTVIYDINRAVVETLRSGHMPFVEHGAQELLDRTLASGMLEIEHGPTALADCEYLILIIGTPVDEHLNPDFLSILRAIEDCRGSLRDGQTLILRSTVYPGVSDRIQRWMTEERLDIGVAFCPERVAQGQSLREFRELPQIISAFDSVILERVRRLFSPFTEEVVEMPPMEAELTKLMTNAWRYLQFAIVNQFYMIASEHRLDFDRILHGCRYKYPRMAGIPGPGFSAGPCLRKDTMQLAAFSHNSFPLGHAAMLVNEGLPVHLTALARADGGLADKTVGILGMAFKAESDDARDSLSYKLRKLLLMEARRVLCTDPYVRDSRLVPLEKVLAESDVLFVGVPHRLYRSLVIPPRTRLVDVWGCVKGPA